MTHTLLHHSVTQAAEKWPENIAYHFLNQPIDYAALEQKTNQLANVLIDHGVSKGDCVGILMDRSLDSAIAVYGILKAGAAYVPIDPLSPVSRICAIVKSCSIHCLITQLHKQSTIEQVVERCHQVNSVIGCNDLATKIAKCASISWEETYKAPTYIVKPKKIISSDIAYVMFTSGSTGTPKGMIHTHGSGHAHARIAIDMYGINASDIIANHAPLHFDISTMGYLTSPMAGATTVMIPEPHTRLPASMTQLMEDHQVTIWYSVPFALIQMLNWGALENRNLDSLRWILYGGEPFSPRQIRQLMDYWPQATFANLYGPAETNQCTLYVLPSSLTGEEEAIPIGTPCPEVTFHIVDDNQESITNEDIGELLIHAPTMMQGYWRRPDLNDQCFHMHPGEQKMYYRTGDLASQDRDGTLHFHGRKDRLVKIRGNRIELDEIEATILCHENVREAAAYVLERGTDNEHIELALLLNTDEISTVSDLHTYLADRVPRFAVPGNIVIHQDFPRTTSGKIDRKALSA